MVLVTARESGASALLGLLAGFGMAVSGSCVALPTTADKDEPFEMLTLVAVQLVVVLFGWEAGSALRSVMVRCDHLSDWSYLYW